MTKSVRIENADTSSYKVVVEVWDKSFPDGVPDKLSHTIELNNPCDITPPGTYITSTRYLVVKEKT